MSKKVSLPLKGGCYCGAVRYEVAAPPLTLYCCHCTNCQKITASAFTLSTIIMEQSFSITKGAPKSIEWTADSGTGRFGLFCGDCGTRIVHGQTPSNGALSLRGGSLDDTSWFKPVGHIWTRSAQKWIHYEPDDLTCDVQPKDYGPWFAAFAAQENFAAMG